LEITISIHFKTGLVWGYPGRFPAKMVNFTSRAPVEMPLLHMFFVFNTCIPMAREE